MKRGVRLENVFLASFYIPLKAFLYKKQLLFKLYSLSLLLALNPQLHSRSATYKRNGLLIRKTAIKSSRPFQCAYYPLTP